MGQSAHTPDSILPCWCRCRTPHIACSILVPTLHYTEETLDNEYGRDFIPNKDVSR